MRLSSSEKVSSLTFRYRFVEFATLGRRYLKGKNTMIIFERYAKWKYKLENRHFLRRGYYVSTVVGNKQAVQKYIRKQEKEDLISEQIRTVEYYNPFEKCLKSNKEK